MTSLRRSRGVVAFAGRRPDRGGPGGVPPLVPTSRACGAAARCPQWRQPRGSSGRSLPTGPRLAAARGFRYLQVDAAADSRPILERLGFVAARHDDAVHPSRRGLGPGRRMWSKREWPAGVVEGRAADDDEAERLVEAARRGVLLVDVDGQLAVA